jgi:hypothetical protein
MKYRDKDGDVWEEASDDNLQCIASATAGFLGMMLVREVVEEEYGPLQPADERPSGELPTVEDVMSRADVFHTAHALVTGLPWEGTEKPSVYDVLSVAKWLEGE